MKQGTNVLFVCTGIVSFEVILFLHISESLSRPPRSSALLPFAKQLLPPGEGWPSRPNLGQPKRIQVPWVLGFMALGYMARKSMVAIETKTMATSLLNFELSSLSMWRKMTMGFSNVSSSYITCSLLQQHFRCMSYIIFSLFRIDLFVSFIPNWKKLIFQRISFSTVNISFF